MTNPNFTKEFEKAFNKNIESVSKHFKHVSEVNSSAETNECVVRLVPFALWCSQLESKEDLFEAVRLYCSFTHTHELVVECCYLYCYAIKLLVNGFKMNKAYKMILEESKSRAKMSGNSVI